MNFADLPRNANARRRILHQARTGTRPVVSVPAVEDAFGTVQAVARYVEAFHREQTNVEFFQVLEDSWKARHA